MSIAEVVKGKNCTGCSACAYCCPVGAIRMKTDAEGFLTPSVDSNLCIECEKCVKKCPIINSDVYKHIVKKSNGYIVQSKNPARKKSASGGAFLSITDVLISKGGVAFGAAFDEENIVKHICVDSISDLSKLQNSKYVQSDMGNSLEFAKGFLDEGRTVLFSGTPCQIAGLYAYLGHDYCNLITVDIICHGVPSPKLLKRQLEEESKSWQGKVKRVSFRYKNPLFKSSSSFYMMMTMTHGLPIVRRPTDDPYFNIFSKGYGFRESCYRCPFASPDRVGDFTLGDCDSHSLYRDFHPMESNSCVIINTDKARQLWNENISKCCDYANLDISKEIKYNKQLGKPSERPPQRDNVYRDLEIMKWIEFSEKYANKQSKMGKFRSYSVLLMPALIVRLWGKLHG